MELALIMGAKAKPHPKERLIMRNGRSLIPAIGDKIKREDNTILPVLIMCLLCLSGKLLKLSKLLPITCRI
jgi:hypothetical protein